MQHVIIVIHLMLVLALIGVVLLQRSEGGGLGIGGGGGGFMSSRGTSNLLTRATAILAGLFFVTSLVLSILAGFNRKPASIVPGAPTSNAPVTPGAPPPLSSGGGLLNQLQGPPATPSGPQVPQSK